MSGPTFTRCQSGRRSYGTREAALQVLAEALAARSSGNTSRRECRAFACPLCGGFHLAATPFDPSRAQSRAQSRSSSKRVAA